jgi:hypothetical protein
MKAIVLSFLLFAPIAQSAEKKPADAKPEKKAVESGLPEKKEEKEDPLSIQNLLDPGKPIPEILPAPEVLPDPPATAGGKSKRVTAGSARSELLSAANDYRRKTELYRKGKLSRDALKSSAVRVATAARNYRAMVRR